MALILTGLGTACNPLKAYEDTALEHINYEEVAHLTDDASSPFCDLSIDYMFFSEEDDSLTAVINSRMQSAILGADYAALAPEAAVDSFKNDYLRNYREEVGELYRIDTARATTREEVPAWYNYTYSLVTSVGEGRNECVLVTADTFVDTGGPHPNQWSQWINYDATTGKQLQREEVFAPEGKAAIEQMLLEALIEQQAEEHPEDSIRTLEDLQKLGFLQLTNMYIPDNFLLDKKTLYFLFNRYDIAPYSAGPVMLEIPYEQIGDYLKY